VGNELYKAALGWLSFFNSKKVKVKQSRYRPGVAQKVAGYKYKRNDNIKNKMFDAIIYN